jgi:hypothetical protein
MGLFDNVAEDVSVKNDDTPDRVKGMKVAPLDSDIYGLNIKYAYGQKSSGGAMGIFLVLDTAEGRTIKATEYVTSGTKKGGNYYYEKKNKEGVMEKKPLPGFSAINSLCKLVAGKGIFECATEKKTIPLYNFDAKGDIPTEVDMIMDLVGKPVNGCVLHTIEDKTKKNDQTGVYEPTGATYAKNTVDKFLSADGRKTEAEQTAGVESAFAGQWLDEWKGKINDESSEVKGAGTKGAPAASGDDAPKSALFS